MSEGLLYIGLGIFWLLMVALFGARKTLSTYIYTAIGCGGIIYGLVLFAKNMSVLFIIVTTALITATLIIGGIIYIAKHREMFPVHLTEDGVPELSAEEKFLREAYKDTEKNKNDIPIK